MCIGEVLLGRFYVDRGVWTFHVRIIWSGGGCVYDNVWKMNHSKIKMWRKFFRILSTNKSENPDMVWPFHFRNCMIALTLHVYTRTTKSD